MPTPRLFLLASLLAGPTVSVPSPVFSAAAKEFPACGAVNSRPVGAGMPDGDHRAGLYRSRFGSVAPTANVQSGQAVDYFMRLTGAAPRPFSVAVPKSADKCLASRHVKSPVTKIDGACVGTRFRVVLDRSSKDVLAVLFALRNDDWKLCPAAKT
jgi:hypothetical protein